MFELWGALVWISTTAQAFGEVAAVMGVSLAVLAGVIAGGVLFAPTRRLAIELAIVILISMALYGRGVHDGDLAVRALWAAADAKAALDKADLEQRATGARDEEVSSRLEQLEADNVTLAGKVKSYEEQDRNRGACLVGGRADGLRDIAGVGPAGHPAVANKRAKLPAAKRKNPAAGHRP
jgi:hypothetical protein